MPQLHPPPDVSDAAEEAQKKRKDDSFRGRVETEIYIGRICECPLYRSNDGRFEDETKPGGGVVSSSLSLRFSVVFSDFHF